MRPTLLFLIIIISFRSLSFGQPASTTTLARAEKDLTIPYSIAITSRHSGTNIAETYNGGIETLFAGPHLARLRLVSLMRIQSVFVVMDKDLLEKVTIVKESGNNKLRSAFTPIQWMQYNKKYTGATCLLTRDTALVLHHVCKKAIISLKDGRHLTAWYTAAIQRSVFSYLEPAFSQVPGLVLKYTYTYRRKTITYTATSISNAPISTDILTAPPGN